ncbi:MAG: AsmA family protein, partial [Steroidobacteraceae bacterium]
TGRTFTLTGDLSLSVFPWLAVQVGPAMLGNAPGFGDAPMVSIAGARLGVKLRPLLKGQFEIGAVELDSPQIALVQTADGNNWSDLGGDQADAATTPAEQPPSKLDASIASVSIRNGSVSYDDRVANTQTTVTNFNFNTGKLQPGQPFDLDSSFTLQRGAALHLDAQLAATITADTDNNQYILQQPVFTLTLKGEGYSPDGMPVNLEANSIVANTETSEYTVEQPEVTLSLSGESYPKSGVPISIKAANILANLDTQTAQVTTLAIDVAGAKLSGELQAKQIMDAPAITGSLNLAPVSLREFAPKLGISLPTTSDANTLQKFTLQANLVANKSSFELKPLTIKLDDTTVTGSAGIADLDSTALRFDLAVDNIDLDRYLAPETEAEAAAASTEPTPIPADAIRDLNLRGKLAINRVIVSKMPLSQLLVGINAANNKLQLDPLQATVYEGKFKGNMLLDASGKQPRLNLEQHLDGINFAPLLEALFDSKRISGRGNANMKLAAVGTDTNAMKQSLNGTLDFTARNGAIEGFDLWYEIRRARAVLKQQSVPARTDAERTTFTSLGGSVTIKDGLANNQDLVAALQYMKVTGQGTVSLVSDAIDYRLNTTVMKIPAEDKLAEQSADLSGLAIPVRITGSLNDPKVRPDVAGLVKEQAKQRIEEEKEKIIDKAKEKIQDKLKGLFGGG